MIVPSPLLSPLSPPIHGSARKLYLQVLLFAAVTFFLFLAALVFGTPLIGA